MTSLTDTQMGKHFITHFFLIFSMISDQLRRQWSVSQMPANRLGYANQWHPIPLKLIYYNLRYLKCAVLLSDLRHACLCEHKHKLKRYFELRENRLYVETFKVLWLCEGYVVVLTRQVVGPHTFSSHESWSKSRQSRVGNNNGVTILRHESIWYFDCLAFHVFVIILMWPCKPVW